MCRDEARARGVHRRARRAPAATGASSCSRSGPTTTGAAPPTRSSRALLGGQPRARRRRCAATSCAARSSARRSAPACASSPSSPTRWWPTSSTSPGRCRCSRPRCSSSGSGATGAGCGSPPTSARAACAARSRGSPRTRSRSSTRRSRRSRAACCCGSRAEDDGGAIERRRIALAELERRRRRRVVALLTDQPPAHRQRRARSSSRTRRCCASGRGCATGSRRTQDVAACIAASAPRPREWDAPAATTDALLRGARLAEVQEMLDPTTLAAVEREFLDASLERQQPRPRHAAGGGSGDLRGARRRARRDQRGRVARDQSAQRGRQERNLALSRSLALESQQMLETDPELALRLALWADETAPTPPAPPRCGRPRSISAGARPLTADPQSANSSRQPRRLAAVSGGDEGVAPPVRDARPRAGSSPTTTATADALLGASFSR